MQSVAKRSVVRRGPYTLMWRFVRTPAFDPPDCHRSSPERCVFPAESCVLKVAAQVLETPPRAHGGPLYRAPPMPPRGRVTISRPQWKRPQRRRVRALRDRLRLVYGRPIAPPHGQGLDELMLTVLS